MKYYYFTKDKLYAFTESTVGILKQNYEVEKEFCLEETGYNLLTKFNNPKLEVKNDLIVNGKSKIKLINKDLPALNMNYTNEQKLSITALKNAFKFVSKSPTRPSLTGVAIYKNGIIATDSFKAYLYGKVESEEKPIILSPELVNEIISTDYEECTLKYDNNTACADFDNGEGIVGKLINTSYPNVANLFNQQLSGKWYSNVNDDLMKLCDFGKFVGKNLAIGTRVIIKDKNMSVEGENIFKDTTELDFTICLEYNLFRTGVEAMKTKSYDLIYNGEMKPLVLKSDNETILLIPMRNIE